MEKHLKYFVPEISDICIGYELEMNWHRAYEEKWVPIKISVQDEEFAYTSELSEIVDALHDGMSEARVPYLTKEQIEAEGWKTAAEDFFTPLFRKDNFTLGYRLEDNKLKIQTFGENSHTLYFGECKCINDFRKIQKLLNIKK